MNTDDGNEIRYFAEVAWDRDRIAVYAEVDDGPGDRIAGGDVEAVDLDDDTPDGYERQHAVVTAALRPLGWEPEPGVEWLDLTGGLGAELGGLRVEVRRIAGSTD